MLHAKTKQRHSAGLTTLSIAWLLTAFVGSAFAQVGEQGAKVPRGGIFCVCEASEVPALPSLDSINAQTDITVFLRDGVPSALRLAALRRAWSADPAICNFRGLQESDWDFNYPDGILGFGELGPEVDTRSMVAELLTETPRSVARSKSQQIAIFGLVFSIR